MNYLETVGKNAKKAFEDLKDVKHKKIKKVLDNYNQSLLKNSNKIIRENLKDVKKVVFYEKPFLKFERLLETYLAFAPKGLESFSKAMPIWIKEKLF